MSFKSSPYSNGSCSWLKDMARTKHLYLSLVCRNDEAALKTSLIQPYSPCLKQHKNKLYHRSQVIRKSWSSEWVYAKTKEICHLIYSSPVYASIPSLCYRWWSMSLPTRSFLPNMTALLEGQRNQDWLERFPDQSQRAIGELKDSSINLKAFSKKFCSLIGFNNKSGRFLFEQQTELSVGVLA